MSFRIPDRVRAWDTRPEPLRLQGTARLSASGFAKVLGDLEARVMCVVWEIGRPAPAQQVHERITREHAVAIHTVIAGLNKLVEKELLRREKRDDLLHYEATLTEAEFRAQASRQVVEGILSFGPDGVTASFVDVLVMQPAAPVDPPSSPSQPVIAAHRPRGSRRSRAQNAAAAAVAITTTAASMGLVSYAASRRTTSTAPRCRPSHTHQLAMQITHLPPAVLSTPLRAEGRPASLPSPPPHPCSLPSDKAHQDLAYQST